MSWDINHVVLVGRLTRDPELTYTPSGAAVCRFSIAVNRTSGSGNPQDDTGTSYFTIVTWNKTAEICKEYLSKGKQVGVEGRLQQRRWAGQDGIRRSTVEIVASNVQFFGPPGPQRGEIMEREQPAVKPESEVGRSLVEEEKVNFGTEDEEPFLSELDDDEIPF